MAQVQIKKTVVKKRLKKPEPREGIVKSVTLTRNSDGTLNMPYFHECLPTGEYRDKLKEYLDLDVLFHKLRYNPMFTTATDSALRLGQPKPENVGYEGKQLKLVWDGDDTRDNEVLNLYRLVALLVAVRYTMMQHQSCEEVAAPAFVFTDLHGQHSDLLRWLLLVGGPDQQQVFNYVICGDSVDRGPRQIETVALLLYYKLRYPHRFFFLRGNHEDYEMHEHYGFLDECRKRCKYDATNPNHPMHKYEEKLYFMFIGVFDWLPSCLVLDRKIFCVHGGLSPPYSMCHSCKGKSINEKKKTRITDICELPDHSSSSVSVDELVAHLNKRIKTPCEIGTAYLKNIEQFRNEVSQKPLDSYCFTMSDLLWSDPTTVKGTSGSADPKWMLVKGWTFNSDRRIAYIFGANVIEKFLSSWQLSLVIRGHDVRMAGYEWHYKKNLITAFSAPGYVNKGNKGCVCMVTLCEESNDKRKLRVDPVVLDKVSAAKTG